MRSARHNRLDLILIPLDLLGERVRLSGSVMSVITQNTTCCLAVFSVGIVEQFIPIKGKGGGNISSTLLYYLFLKKFRYYVGMKERMYGAIEWTADKSKKVDVVVGGIGLVGIVAGISGAAPVVALSAVSYFAGQGVENWAKKRKK